MNFKRATTVKQRESRRESIIDACMVIYLQGGFHEITFAKIGELIDINRSVIYSYYSCPADVLIDFLSRRMDEYLLKLTTSGNPEKISPLVRLVGEMDLDDEFKSVAAIFYTVLEPAGSETAVSKFRTRFERFVEQLYIIAVEDCPELSLEEYHGYYELFMVMYIGVASTFTRDERVLQEFGGSALTVHRLSVCESALLVFQNTRYYEEAKEYWEKVRDIVLERSNEQVEFCCNSPE